VTRRVRRRAGRQAARAVALRPAATGAPAVGGLAHLGMAVDRRPVGEVGGLLRAGHRSAA
jgi:hypothetical protein